MAERASIPPPGPAYAELHCVSAFSFQRGASSPAELLARAHALGYHALALTDAASVAGVVRAWEARQRRLQPAGLLPGEQDWPWVPPRLLCGAEFIWDEAPTEADSDPRPDAAHVTGTAAAATAVAPITTPAAPAALATSATSATSVALVSGDAAARPRVVALARHLAGWGGLCQAITAVRAGHPVPWPSLAGCVLLLVPARAACTAATERLLTQQLKQLARQVWGKPDALGAMPVAPATPAAPNAHRVPTTPDVPRGIEPGAQPSARCARRARAAQALNSTNADSEPALWLAAELLADRPDDTAWAALLARVEAASGVPVVAAGDVHQHSRARLPLQHVQAALALGRPVADCGFALHPNAERHLRSRARLAGIYPQAWLARTLAVAAQCRFELAEVRYNYPREALLPGLTPLQTLRRLAAAGARWRYPQGVPASVRRLIARELALIAECGYEMFFLTVHDIVRFARSRGILCQGRGSAANSAVCFVLGITAVDPTHATLLLERFISRARRAAPPDIDVDFEHQRREEVIQYIYAKYGRDRAALAATVISYRRRSALRDVGRALGVDAALVDAAATDRAWFEPGIEQQNLAELAQAHGVPVAPRVLAQWLELAAQLQGLPRHLSQHVGGFVLTDTPLTRLVPVQPAAMDGRTTIQWDKDDLEALGLIKVDVLALGMLTALRGCLDLRQQWRGGPRWGLADIPTEDAATYAAIQRADTVGVFQIESRAQMSMLPRLRPATFYDLVVQVAIVRPGPIQGGMVHPYLKARERQRRGLPMQLEKPELAPALARTLGVPIFQEQVMQLAMVAAGFSAEAADALRRAMAAWKRHGHVHRYHEAIVEGMVARGYERAYAERIFAQILGFGEYGFPESHAHSFALLTYASCWLKRHEPACYLAALLNAQPLGFYTPWQLVQDARRHGVDVRPICVQASNWDATLEGGAGDGSGSGDDGSDGAGCGGSANPVQPAVRLGLALVAGLPQAAAERVVAARAQCAFASVADLARRAELAPRELRLLAAADALAALSGHRRQQLWQAAAHQPARALLADAAAPEVALALAAAPEAEAIALDHVATGLSLRRHPLALLRPRLAARHWLSVAELARLPGGRRVRACGLVTVRQQPTTAKGTLFLTLEDETGPLNVVVWQRVREEQPELRRALLHARLLAVRGRWERAGPGGRVMHLVAESWHDCSAWLGELAAAGRASRDFH